VTNRSSARSLQTWTRGRAHEATAAVAHPPPGVRSSPPAPEAQDPPAWPGAGALSRSGSPRRRRPNSRPERPICDTSTRRASIAVRGQRKPNPARRRVPVHKGAHRRRQRHIAGVRASTAVRRRQVRGAAADCSRRRPREPAPSTIASSSDVVCGIPGTSCEPLNSALHSDT
jgi:hypothetical protein